MIKYTILILIPIIASCMSISFLLNFRKRTTLVSHGNRFPSSELALVEKDLRKLNIVHVVCHKIEQPDENFRAAVIDNLKEHVKYIFYVPHCEYGNEKNRKLFLKYFEAAIEIAQIESEDNSIDFQDLFDFRCLPGEWNDYPYIFYQYSRMESDENFDRLIAFRGNRINSGISDNYELVGEASAKTIAMAINLDFDRKKAKFTHADDAEVVVRNLMLENRPVANSESSSSNMIN